LGKKTRRNRTTDRHVDWQ